MGVRFAIEDWAACASGLLTPVQWREWARDPWLPEGLPDTRLERMPAMQRRRLNALGRAAAEAAWDCHEPHEDTPVVFASGRGDARRCLQLLHGFASTGDAAPTDFTLSVHNAIGAMYSIARGDQSAYASIAAGPASAAAALVEAAGLLSDGARQVLVVCYEAPLPDDYAVFEREAPAAWAWAWRVTATRPGIPSIELAWSDAVPQASPRPSLPFGLEALRFAVSEAAGATIACEGGCWTWSRHA